MSTSIGRVLCCNIYPDVLCELFACLFRNIGCTNLVVGSVSGCYLIMFRGEVVMVPSVKDRTLLLVYVGNGQCL